MASLIPAAIGAVGSIAGGMLSSAGSRPRETDMQKKKRALIDDLLASIQGKGNYNDLFQMDDAAFQKSYVDPAKSRFQNQIAPQIQQSYIAGGQQRGTGLDDTLTRAGVDMDQLLNEQYMNFQQNAMNRKQNAINGILNADNGVAPGTSKSDQFQQAAGGYLASDNFQENFDDILGYWNKKGSSAMDANSVGKPGIRRGFSQ